LYVGHTSEDGREQSVIDHLKKTAQLAGDYAQAFGAGELGYQIGLAHDIGKYSAEFQRHILHNAPSADHSTCGAKELKNLNMLCAAICVAGHHTGLPDFGNPRDTAENSTLCGRLKREPPTLPDYSEYLNEISLKYAPFPRFGNNFDNSFFTRMLYSCLVDADFLDTEAFMSNGIVQRGGYDHLDQLASRLEAYIQPWWDAKSELNKKRCEILKSCLDAGSNAKGLYSLTVPTGGGKTVSSLAFALLHAVEHKMSRIIYVIPYTSIIEQTADVFRKIVGAENVLEHHSNISFDPKDDTEKNRNSLSKLRLSAENWDAPVIVTTNVQFFESLFANKSSKCRKLHNLANSVIIFDEAQMLPLPYLKPCVRAIANLVQYYGATAVLCTATQPSLEKLFPADMTVTEICPNTSELYEFFRRTSLRHIGKQSNSKLAEHMAQQEQALTIVNSRKQAHELFELLPKEGRFHLSTLMTPVHRRKVLCEIRQRLKNGLPCRLVATSLVEAGVDVDFPAVFRAEAGLDSIIQAAGRCNREGRRTAKESVVYIFESEDKPPRLIEQNIKMMREVARRFSDLAAPQTIHNYFDTLHSFQDENLDKKRIIDAFEHGRSGCLLPFAQVASDFRLIETETKSVLIAIEEDAVKLADEMQWGNWSRQLTRKATQYIVNVYPQHFKVLVHTGAVSALTEDMGILKDVSLYSEHTGLSLNCDEGQALFG